MLVNLRMKMKRTALSHILVSRERPSGRKLETKRKRSMLGYIPFGGFSFNLSVLMLSLTFLNFHSQCRRAVKALASSFIKAFAARRMPHVLAHANRE